MNPIPVKELRIGNIVMNIENGASKIIVCDIINLRQNHIPSEPSDYWTTERKEAVWLSGGYNEAIPLTEEWLVKLGFERDDEDGVYVLDLGRKVFRLYPDGDNAINYQSDIGLDWCEVGDAESVHKFQNLFYILAGYDLTINESHG